MTAPPVLDAATTEGVAHFYASLGWRVVPIIPGTKHPRPTAWQDAATTDPVLIAEWWGHWPDHGIGLVAGPESDLLILDVDPAHGGDDSLADLEAEHSALPETVEAITGGGGRHLLFRWPTLPEGKSLGNSAGKLGPGLDIRAKGGQVVAFPTIHPDTGRRYEWEASSRPGETALAPAPEWLVALLLEDVVELPEGQIEDPSQAVDVRFAWDNYSQGPGANERAVELLMAQGWHSLRRDRSGTLYLTRPGKMPGKGSGVSIGRVAPGVVYCFTSEAPPLAAEHGYGLADLYAEIHHAGSRSHADAALVAAGWGAASYSVPPAEVHAYVAGEHARAVTMGLAAPEPQRTPGRFRVWSMAELNQSDLTLRWAVRGLIADPTYGMIAGELKTLKSYVAALLAASVASGQALFDRFTVDRQGPVLTYVGEGGRIPWTRRMQRIAQALDVDPATLMMDASFDVAAIDSPRFQVSFLADLEERAPALFLLDPYYAFHGSSVEASNLHQEGGLLASLSAPADAAGANLMVVNHFNQTGSGGGLKRITQSGSGEWVDSWLLLSHREVPEVAAGKFQLTMEIGSRQWGGSSWDLDLSIGRFDPETGTHDGKISWELRTAADPSSSPQARALEMVQAAPGELSKEEIAKGIGGRIADARRFVAAMEERGVIVPKLVERRRSDGKMMKVWAYFEGDSEKGRDVGSTASVPISGPWDAGWADS